MFSSIPAKNLAWRLVVVLLLVMAVGFRASPAQAGNDHIFVNEIVPYDNWLYNECGAEGAGEYIHFTGSVHVVLFEITNGSGGAVYQSMVNPLNMSGVGEISGITYRGTGMSQGISTVHNIEDGTYTSINNFYLIGQGPGNNLLVHSTFHITANQDGTNVIMVENSFDKCR